MKINIKDIPDEWITSKKLKDVQRGDFIFNKGKNKHLYRVYDFGSKTKRKYGKYTRSKTQTWLITKIISSEKNGSCCNYYTNSKYGNYKIKVIKPKYEDELKDKLMVLFL